MPDCVRKNNFACIYVHTRNITCVDISVIRILSGLFCCYRIENVKMLPVKWRKHTVYLKNESLLGVKRRERECVGVCVRACACG